MAGPTFSSTRRLIQAKAREYSIVDKFTLGYRNREDVTNLPPGVLIVGSQNVLTNVSERVQIRQGYSVDGDASSVIGPVLASFDWLTRANGERHLRAGSLTSAANDGKLQYRYVASDGTVTWHDLMTALTTVAYNFTSFWNTTESLREALFVNGTSNIFRWNGAITTLASATASTLTKSGTDSWNDAGFYSQSFSTIGGTSTQFDITNPSGTTFRYTWDTNGTDPLISATTVPIGSYILLGTQNFNAANNGLFVVTGVGASYFEVTNASGVAENNKTIGSGFIYNQYTKVLKIGTNTYAYTGGETTTTLTGVTPTPAAEVAGAIVVQAVITTANTAMTSITATFANGLIRVLNNQVFLGALNSSVLWISKVNSFTDYSSSTPRQTGEGASLILDSQLVALDPQENFMYVSAGKDLWYNVNFEVQTSTVGVTYEQVNALPLKTGRQQGASTQAYVSHMKNDIIVLTNEPTVDTFGRVETSLATPQTTNISDPIKLDMDQYDFTDGSIFYWRYYILLAVPKEGIVRIFNLNTKNWEAPQTLPISRFYIVDGELYGHSYNSFESYKLFTGYADRVYSGFTGFPIQANWVFSYNNFGSRFSFKRATKAYVEGYINTNTMLGFSITYELDGCKTVKDFTLDGSNGQFVCLVSSGSGSLGKESLGIGKLGGDITPSINGLPPKFRWFPTMSPTDFFECSVGFSVLGVDNRAELLSFGLAVGGSSQIPVQKMD